MNYVQAEYNPLLLHRPFCSMIQDTREYRMSACMTACSLPLVCIVFQSLFSPPHSSFNSNSLFLSSSLHTHLFACHFPFMSITISLHYSFLWHRPPSLTPSPTISSSLLLMLPSLLLSFNSTVFLSACKAPSCSSFVSPPFSSIHFIDTSFLLLASSSSIMPLPFVVFLFLHSLSSPIRASHIHFIFLQDASAFSSSFAFIPHILLSLQHAASSRLLLLYSSQQ